MQTLRERAIEARAAAEARRQLQQAESLAQLQDRRVAELKRWAEAAFGHDCTAAPVIWEHGKARIAVDGILFALPASGHSLEVRFRCQGCRETGRIGFASDLAGLGALLGKWEDPARFVCYECRSESERTHEDREPCIGYGQAVGA